MAIEGKIKPDEDFWINLSAESIYGSSERMVKAGETLKTVITWAFGIFTVGGFALTIFGTNLKTYDHYGLYLFGGAFFLLTIAQILIVKSQAPVTISYNPYDPVQINIIFVEKVRTQSAIFNWAMGIAFTAFFLLAAGILIQFAALTKKDEEKKCPPFLIVNTGIEKRANATSIPVTVEYKKDKNPIQVTITNLTTGTNNPLPVNSPLRLLVDTVFYTDKAGKLYYSYKLAVDSVKTLLVKITAREKDSTNNFQELSKLITLNIPNQ
ncbi:MAG TPA: hypothetical protein VK484_11015 [Ferruginibacter sp.]|nr:hypothetical protein [Ferruginibacter sp.]